MLIELVFGSAFLCLFSLTEIKTFGQKLKLPAFLTTTFMLLSFLITHAFESAILAYFIGLLLADMKIFRNWSEIKILVGIGFLMGSYSFLMAFLILSATLQVLFLMVKQDLKITPMAISFVLTYTFLYFI